MKEKQLIKVVAVVITGVDGGRMETQSARGICALKRGQALMDFVQQFLDERGITAYSLHQRSDGYWATSPMMFLNQEPRQVLTFHFIQFGIDELGFYAKDLATSELERDIKPLQKYIYKE